jgi:hypothetical protein
VNGAQHQPVPLARRRVPWLSPVVAHPVPRAEYRFACHRAKQHDEAGADQREFGVEPVAASANLAAVGPLMNPALAAGLPPEVLDRVGEVDVVALDATIGERLIQHMPGGANERMALLVLLVAGLLADEEERRVQAALAEHDLRRAFIQRAPRARPGIRGQPPRVRRPPRRRPRTTCRAALCASHDAVLPGTPPFHPADPRNRA